MLVSLVFRGIVSLLIFMIVWDVTHQNKLHYTSIKALIHSDIRRTASQPTKGGMFYYMLSIDITLVLPIYI